jgi:very-short-patch-repair endonuclease
MKIPDIIKQAARELRKNMTLAEKILWEEIRR